MMTTVKNDFHNSECRLRLRGQRLSIWQIDRCRATLCQPDDCWCGGIIKQQGPDSIVDNEGQQYAARLDFDSDWNWFVRISAI